MNTTRKSVTEAEARLRRDLDDGVHMFNPGDDLRTVLDDLASVREERDTWKKLAARDASLHTETTEQNKALRAERDSLLEDVARVRRLASEDATFLLSQRVSAEKERDKLRHDLTCARDELSRCDKIFKDREVLCLEAFAERDVLRTKLEAASLEMSEEHIRANKKGQSAAAHKAEADRLRTRLESAEKIVDACKSPHVGRWDLETMAMKYREPFGDVI